VRWSASVGKRSIASTAVDDAICPLGPQFDALIREALRLRPSS
jgi:hypothetical protein